jgi:hypothetical protein
MPNNPWRAKRTAFYPEGPRWPLALIEHQILVDDGPLSTMERPMSWHMSRSRYRQYRRQQLRGEANGGGGSSGGLFGVKPGDTLDWLYEHARALRAQAPPGLFGAALTLLAEAPVGLLLQGPPGLFGVTREPGEELTRLIATFPDVVR